MTKFDEINQLPYRFRGGLAFNQRTVAAALGTLLGETDEGAFLAGTPLGLSELTNVLLLLESIAMADGMYLDGTLPPRDVERLSQTVWRIGAQSGVKLEIDFLRPAREALGPMFQRAAEAASLLIDDSLERIDEQKDSPLAGDITRFVSTLRSVAEDKTGRVAGEVAETIVEAAASGQESFRGSKCVAGLVLATQDPVPLVRRAHDILRQSPGATQRKVVAVLINRFRINYVNSLAELREAAYLADFAIEDLKSAQVVLFCRYLSRQISTTHAAQLTEETKRLFDNTLRAVPLGFAILMNARESSAAGLIKEALDVRALGFGRAAAGDTPQHRYLHQLSDEEFGSFQAYLFKRDWVRLMNEAERAEWTTGSWKSLYIPSGLGGIVGAVVGAVAAGPLGGALGSATGAAGQAVGGAIGSVLGTFTQVLGDSLAKGLLAGQRVNVDHYRHLDKYLALAVRNDRTAQALADRVQEIFKRTLGV